MDHRVAVIDNGTGFTKMGWAGNPTPTYDIPTVIADHVDKVNYFLFNSPGHRSGKQNDLRIA